MLGYNSFNSSKSSARKPVIAPQNALPESARTSILGREEPVEKAKKPVADIITERFIDQLRKGVIPWQKPWISIKGEFVGAWGHGEKGKPYSLLNQMMLPKEGEYITFNQIRKEGGTLKKGSKGYQIFYYDSFKTTQKNPNTNVDEEIYIPFLKYYTVFHISDTEGITQNHQPDMSALDGLKEPQRCKKADELIKNYLERSGVKINHEAQDKAYYSHVFDSITLPLKKQFKKRAEYYSTVFHELVHSTGHKTRFDRFSKRNAFKGCEYSIEELVAEIGASAILYKLGIETKSSIQNSHAYLSSWMGALENDHRMIVNASSRAEKAVKYIFGELSPKKAETNEN